VHVEVLVQGLRVLHVARIIVHSVESAIERVVIPRAEVVALGGAVPLFAGVK